MLERKNVLVLAIILALAGLTSPSLVHLAHAATGEVCLADPTTSTGSTTPCPATPAVFDGPPGQEIRIGVFIQGSDGLSGFNVILLTNHAFLKPVGVDLTGTVLLGNYYTLAECLSGFLISGSACSIADTMDTLDLAEFSGLGIGDTASPTTGLLFTAIYNITGTNSAGNPVTVGFQTGCFNTSVSPGLCVTVVNHTGSPASETVQTGTAFDNSASTTMPTVALSINPSSLGPQFPGVAGIATITATAVNGFPGFGADSVAFTDIAPPSLTATFQGANSCATLGTSCSVTLALSSTTAGNYSVTVFGTYSTLDANGNSETLVNVARVNLVVWDFGFSLGSSIISLISGTNGNDKIILTSQNGFASSITLSAGSSIPSGLTTSIAPATVALQAHTSANSTISFSAPQNATGIYRVQIHAASGSQTKTATCTIRVTAGGSPDFSLFANPSGLVLSPNGSASSVLSVIPINGFSNPVSFSITRSPGLTASIFPQQIAGSGNATLTFSSTVAGNYTAQVFGTSGTISHNVTLAINVTSTPIGRVCLVASGASSCPFSAAPITASVGGQVRVSVLIQNSAALSGFDITLLSDHTVLRPDGVDLAGTTLPAPMTIATECLGGVLVQGPRCSSTDTPDTIHLVVLSEPGLTTKSPTTGLLFTAIFNVTANTTGTDIGFQTGCLGLTSTPPLCITIAEAPMVDPVRETDPIAIFSTSTSPDLGLTADPPALSVAAGSKASSTVFLTSFNGFTGNVTLSTSILPTTGLTCALSSTTVSAVSETSTLSCGGNGGTYNVTVTGTSGTLSHSTTIHVIVQDFGVNATPSSISIAQGSKAASMVNVTSIDGFSGTVSLTASYSPSLQVTLTPNSVSASGSSILNITATSAALGTYLVNVTGKSDSISHTTTVTITVSATNSRVLPPILLQATWSHRLSLSKTNGVQTWELGILNPNHNATLYASLRIVGTDNLNTTRFTINTVVYKLSPSQKMMNIQESQTFTAAQVGTTFTITITIQWGLTPTASSSGLPFTSTSTRTGSFTIQS